MPVFKNLVCGCFCTIFIDDKKHFYGFGLNESGKLGYPTKDVSDFYIYSPKVIDESKDIQDLDCGSLHTICCTNDGKVYSFGDNYYGQLGIGDMIDDSHLLQQILFPSNVKIEKIFCGNYFTICLSSNNKLWSFGHNKFGQLGLNKDNTKCKIPECIPLINVELVACGSYSVYCKTFDGDCYAWGDNTKGQLGHNNCISCKTPILCKYWPKDILSIKAGAYHTVILINNGTLFVCGDNSEGQLGIGDNIPHSYKPTIINNFDNIKKIECGYHHTMCIDINNNLWVFGSNSAGQLGMGDKEDHLYIPTKHIIVDVENVSGGLHTFVKTCSDGIYAFGCNNSGQLGFKGNEYQMKPIKVLEEFDNIWPKEFISRQKSARK